MPSIDEIIADAEDASICERKCSRLSEYETQVQYVGNGFWGIVLAGAVYPSIVGLITIIVTPGFLDQLPSWGESIAWTVLFVVGFGVCGFVASALMGGMTIPFVIVVNQLLGNHLSPRNATLCAGSLAGYIPLCLILIVPPVNYDAREFFNAIASGPVLAMTLGAFFAAKSSARYSRVLLATTKPEKKPLLISHLMIATALIAVVLATGNFFGGTGFMICVGFWCGAQMLLLAFAELYRRCWSH